MRTNRARAIRGLAISSLMLGASLAGIARGMPAVSQEFEAYMVKNHYVAVALDRDEGSVNEQTVDAIINGKKLTLLVDTGSSQTFLNAATAERLHLNVEDTGHSEWGVGGEIVGHVGITQLQSFTLGGFAINRTSTILVLPKTAHPIRFTDGVLGMDWLDLNSAVYPVGGKGLLLKPGSTPAVSIADFMQRLGFRSLAVESERRGLIADGHINNKPMRALFDSGCAFSSFEASFVRDAVGHYIPAFPFEIEGVDGQVPQESYFLPKEMDLGGMSLPPSYLVSTTGAGIAHSQVTGLLGEDVMGVHDTVIDLGDHVVWMK